MTGPWLQCAILACLIGPSIGIADINGYEWLADWNSLPRAKTGLAAGTTSSYDRSGKDDDYNSYQSPPGFRTDDEAVVGLDIPGPGVLTRFWMPHLAASRGFLIRVIVDGRAQIETTSKAWFSGQCGYFGGPLVQTLLGGQVSYEPIAFARSLRIETENRTGIEHYYQYNYLALPAQWPVAPYASQLSAQQRSARDLVVKMIGNVGQNPGGSCATARMLVADRQAIPAGASATLWRLDSSGTIRSLALKMPPKTTDTQLDGLRLCIRYGREPRYAIDVPVSHFFGAGHGRVPYRSLPLGTDGPDGYYCYWPMPYRRGVSVELRNTTTTAVPIESARLEYDPTPPLADAGSLHAVHDEERTKVRQEHHVLLDVPGAGHYVGNLLYFAKVAGGQSLLEGDDIIIVNPGKPTERLLCGTGLEDAYNGGFYYNHAAAARDRNDPLDPPDPASGIAPYHGLLHIQLAPPASASSTRVDQYRWMIGDFVPFTDGIVVKIENFAAQPDILFGSTAFYYATIPPVSTSQPSVVSPVEARTP